MKTWAIFGATSQTLISSTLRRGTSTIWSKYQYFLVSTRGFKYLPALYRKYQYYFVSVHQAGLIWPFNPFGR